MKRDQATAIALDVWKDPQGYALIEQARDEAWLYFRCYDRPGVAADVVGCLHFEGVWHLSSTRFRRLRGYPDVADTDLTSYYLVVEDSSLLDGLSDDRNRAQPDWRRYDRRHYRHWIVESHDYCTNIIAAAVSFASVDGEAARRCFSVWDRVE